MLNLSYSQLFQWFKLLYIIRLPGFTYEGVSNFLYGNHKEVSLWSMSWEPEVGPHRLHSVCLGPIGGRPKVASQPVGKGGTQTIAAFSNVLGAHLSKTKFNWSKGNLCWMIECCSHADHIHFYAIIVQWKISKSEGLGQAVDLGFCSPLFLLVGLPFIHRLNLTQFDLRVSVKRIVFSPFNSR